MLFLVALLFSCASSQGDPACPLFTVQDQLGNTYTYDLSKFKVPDSEKSLFVQGTGEKC
jgi:hypothetical protein